MNKLIYVVVLAPLLLGALAAESARPIFKVFDFSERDQSATISHMDVEVTLQPIADDEDSIAVSAAIRIQGFQSIIVTEGVSTSRYYTRGVGIGKLSATDAVPSVLLTGFTGGAHCCATLRVITPVSGKLKVLEFVPVDGEPNNTFPVDVDGDGTVDFQRQDDSFRYQFSSGAGSFSPPIILNIYKGNIVNVSSESAFRPIWVRFAAQTRARCTDKTDSDRNGACAAYVAAGARLGQFEKALQEANGWAYQGEGAEYPSECKVDPIQYVCPSGQEIKFYTFQSAVNWFLRKNKYID